jgi:hypothetical protein
MNLSGWILLLRSECIQLNNLGVHIAGEKVLSFDVKPVKQSFFSACNCIYSKAKDIAEIINLSLQESYCLPVLTYVLETLKLTAK